MKYDSYKDTKIPWIGQIPSHWGQCRLKSYNTLKGRIGWNGLRSEEFLTEGYAYLVTGQDFSGKDIQWDKCYQIEKSRYDEDPFIQLKNGDLLITKDGTIGKIATVNNLDKPACLNSGIFVMKQTKDIFEQGYLFWMLSSDLLKEFNNYTSSGTTILHLYQNVFENMPILIPPKAEQKAISDYLEKKCADIDKAIATQQKRIDLFKEQEQVIIVSAVLNGLTSKVEMLDSKIPYIGKIPAHWTVMPLKYTAQGKGCCFIDGDWIESKDISTDGIKYLTTGNVGPNKYKEQGSGYITEEKFRELDCKDVYPGDLLISRLNEPIARTCIVPELDTRIVTAVDNVIFRPNPKVLDRYFAAYYLNNAKFTEHANIIARGATMHRISRTMLGHLKIALPPIEEQKQIVSYLDNQTAPLESAISNAERKIELLRSYKKSLIAEVVTGKRKVI